MKALAALLALVLALAPARAAACSCMALPVETAIAQSQAIFEGRVASVEPDGDARVVRLDVVQTWRGANAEHVEVRTSAREASCGYPFEVGRSYLVYATESEGTLAVSLCSRTRPIEEAAEDRVALGSGVIPVDIADDPEREPHTRGELPPRAGGCAGCSVAGGSPGGALVLAAIALSALAARRRIR